MFVVHDEDAYNDVVIKRHSHIRLGQSNTIWKLCNKKRLKRLRLCRLRVAQHSMLLDEMGFGHN